jgi:hypothetical protein
VAVLLFLLLVLLSCRRWGRHLHRGRSRAPAALPLLLLLPLLLVQLLLLVSTVHLSDDGAGRRRLLCLLRGLGAAGRALAGGALLRAALAAPAGAGSQAESGKHWQTRQHI